MSQPPMTNNVIYNLQTLIHIYLLYNFFQIKRDAIIQFYNAVLY